MTVFLDNYVKWEFVCVREPEMDLIYDLENCHRKWNKNNLPEEKKETLSFIRNILVPTRMGICMRKET